MAKNLDASVNQRFSSRLGFLLSVIGIAVGTGNIWREPGPFCSPGQYFCSSGASR
jgi:SNF family Na+-dependent transporter